MVASRREVAVDPRRGPASSQHNIEGYVVSVAQSHMAARRKGELLAGLAEQHSVLEERYHSFHELGGVGGGEVGEGLLSLVQQHVVPRPFLAV